MFAQDSHSADTTNMGVGILALIFEKLRKSNEDSR